MKTRDFVLLMVYIAIMTIVAGGASFLVALWTNNIVGTALAMLFVTGIGTFFILRWWLRIARTAGITTKIEWTPSRVTLAIAYLSAILLATAVNYANYSFTKSRLSEFAVSLIVLFPILAFLAWKASLLANTPKPQEASMLRFSFYMQFVLAILFSLNLALQIRPWHQDYDPDTGQNLIIAAYIVLVPLFPINAYYIRKRYLQARESAMLSRA